MTINCVTLDSTGQILRIGSSDFENDGSYDAGTETFHSDVSSLVGGVDMKYQKIVSSVCTEMTAGEKLVVEGLIHPSLKLNYPLGEPESLSSNGAISLDTYMTELSGNVDMTLQDGTRNMQTKLILSQGGASPTITLSLDQTDDDYVSFSLGANNKAHVYWDNLVKVWRFMDWKGVTKNT